MILPPDTLYPTVKKGFVKGLLRLEKHGGGEDLYLPGGKLIDFKPLIHNGETYAVTGLQKKSEYGWLLMDPFIFYSWRTWRFQKQDANGGWISGTECVTYIRSPGLRKDFASTDGKFWVFTKGYFSFTHYD